MNNVKKEKKDGIGEAKREYTKRTGKQTRMAESRSKPNSHALKPRQFDRASANRSL